MTQAIPNAAPFPSRNLWAPRRKLRVAAWSLRHVRNWPEVYTSRLTKRLFDAIRLRSGFQIPLTNDRWDLITFLEIFYDRVYTPPVQLRAAGVVVDIGANCGMFSLLAASELVPDGRVFAVEPNPVCLDAIRRSIEVNRLNNVEVIAGVAGHGKKKAALHLHPRETGSSSIYELAGTNASVTVDVHEPRSLLRLAPVIDLLKIDCEGGEHCMVWETEPEDWLPVRSVVMEYHLGMRTGYPSDRNARLLARRLTDFGYQIVKFTGTDYGYLFAARPDALR